MQQQYSESLTQIVTTNFPANHLINLSLMQRTPLANQRDLKEKFFFFFTLAPGEGEQANRTYNMKDRKISLKFSTREIAGFAETLYQCAIGNQFNVLPYTKFTKSEQGGKSVSIWITSKHQVISGNTVEVRSINVAVSHNKIKHNVSFTIADALGFSTVVRLIVEKAVNFEVNNFQKLPFQQKQLDQPQPQQYNIPNGQNEQYNTPNGQYNTPNGQAGNQIQHNINQQHNFAPQNPYHG